MIKIFRECLSIQGGKWILAVGAAGLLLLLFGTQRTEWSTNKERESAQENVSVQFYTEHLEEKIEELCCQIRGINEAHVLLTLEGSSEFVYAENSSGTAGEYVLMRSGDAENPLLVQEIYPQIRGVAVVCSHGDDSAVRLAVTELLAAALGIPASAIRVAGT